MSRRSRTRGTAGLPGAIALASILALAASAGCTGSTGSALVTFGAAAGGPTDATGGPLTFRSGRGYTVTLTRARLFVGAVYLNRSVPISGGQELACIAPGVYVGEVLAGLTVDALSPALVPFPGGGHGTADPAAAGELWLTGGDVNAAADATVILDAAGTAEKDGAVFPFEAKLTIGDARSVASADPARPGANPTCKLRIVRPILTSFTLAEGGTLELRVDPRPWFANVSFEDLEQVASDPPLYRFADVSEGQPNVALFTGFRAAQGVYSLAFRGP